MKIKNNQGFAVLEVILILVALVAIAGLGWKVYDTNKKNRDLKKQNQSLEAKSETANTTTASPAPSATKDPNDGYLVIKEWGVRVPITPTIGDLYYQMLSGESFSSANFSLHSLVAKQSDCAPDQIALSAITRLKAGDVLIDNTTAEQAAKTNANVKKVGDYYYSIQHSQAYCEDPAKTQVSFDDAAITASLRAIEAAK